MRNLILSTDSYKHSHFKQYPPGAKFISSYIEARKGDSDKQITQFFGLQAFIEEYLMRPVTLDDITEAEELLKDHGLPFNKEDWLYIVKEYDGFLPITIQALPEGSVVPRGMPLVQVRNNDERLPWLTSFIETALLRSVWYPSSVATLSFITKSIIYDGLLKTSDDPISGGLMFKLHDFGARGVSSSESAALGGAAHLVNFMGTDTLEAIQAIRRYYGSSSMPAFSIPASEHSTMTSWGESREADAYENMIDQFGDGMFSIVSDSYDLFNAIKSIYGEKLKEKILGMKGVLVVRPDSGNPIMTPVSVVNELWNIFGGTVNSKGYKVLNPKIRVIQGDGMNAESIGALVSMLVETGFSVENIAFGMGGGLLQDHMRDDMRFAMKANAIDFGDGWIDVQKKPATDPSKASKAGRVAVIEQFGEYVCVREDALGFETNLLKTVYECSNDVGRSSVSTNFDAIRDVAQKCLVKFHTKHFGAEQKEAA